MSVSVIVPVYNVEPYLEKCLESLVNQTLDSIEIIVVNDGSLDQSEKIIERFQKEYPKKIVYVKKKNGGLSSARNEGIKIANGEYIGFLDGDDFCHPSTFFDLYKKAKENNFDMVVCNMNYVYDQKIEEVKSNLVKDLKTKKEVKENFSFIYPSVWNRIYKKECLDGLFFKEGIWYEDVEFNFRVYPKINSIGYVDKPLIQYVQRPTSISKTIDKRLLNYIDNFNGLIDFYKKNNYYKPFYSELEYSYVRYIFATFIKQISYSADEKLFQEGLEKAIDNVHKHFPNYKKNKYLKPFSWKNFYLKHFNKFFANLIHLKNRRNS